MPVFFQQDITPSTRIGVWKISEPESFFLRSVLANARVGHPFKHLQHLAGRYLLSYLFPDFPLSLIKLADTRKPYLEGEEFHFSISHSNEYAAAIVSRTERVGIDVEIISDKIQRVAKKFVRPDETKGTLDASTFYTLVWSCKESVFKWYGKGGVDFMNHLQITKLEGDSEKFRSQVLFSKDNSIVLPVTTRIWENLCLSYIHTSSPF